MSYTIHKCKLEIARPLTRDSNACVRLQRTRFYLVEVLVEDAAVWNCRGYGAGTDKESASHPLRQKTFRLTEPLLVVR
jgi:hypothetical protein